MRPYHPLVVLAEDGDSGLFDDDVCDLMKVTEDHPALCFRFLLLVFIVKLLLSLILFL